MTHNGKTVTKKITVTVTAKPVDPVDPPVTPEDKAEDWKKTHQQILNKTKVEAGDKTAITAALTAYEALEQADRAKVTAEKTKLDNQQKAVAFLEEQGTVLNKDDSALTNSDLATLLTAKTKFDALDANVKSYLADTVATRLDAAAKANNWKTTYRTEIAKTQVTAGDKAQLDAAVTAHDALSQAAKNLLGTTDITALQNKKAAADWQSTHAVL